MSDFLDGMRESIASNVILNIPKLTLFERNVFVIHLPTKHFIGIFLCFETIPTLASFAIDDAFACDGDIGAVDGVNQRAVPYIVTGKQIGRAHV